MCFQGDRPAATRSDGSAGRSRRHGKGDAAAHAAGNFLLDDMVELEFEDLTNPLTLWGRPSHSFVTAKG